MLRPNTTITTSCKLESAKGTILGTITIPWHWAEVIRLKGEFSFFLPHGKEHFPVRCAQLVESSGLHPDALELIGCTLEEFERVPGCSFAPGAAYLRSIIE